MVAIDNCPILSLLFGEKFCRSSLYHLRSPARTPTFKDSFSDYYSMKTWAAVLLVVICCISGLH